jgi:hypothetical protein
MRGCEVELTMFRKVPHHSSKLTRLATLRRSARPVEKRIAIDALISGTAASLASAAALMAGSKVRDGSWAGGLNGPSQWLWGESEAYTRKATLRHTAVGYAIHHSTSIFWALLHEGIFGGSRRKKPALQHCTEAIASATTAYVVDYHFTPRRLRPGFEKHVSPTGMVAVYAAFAAGLAVTAILRDRYR